MTPTIPDLRSALRELADQAPPLAALDHSAWREPGSTPTRRRRRTSGRLVGALAAAAAVVALTVGLSILVPRQHGATPSGAGPTATTLEARPLIAPPVTVHASGPYRDDPLRSLNFAIPTTDTAYSALTPRQRADLRAALAETDCAAQGGSTAAWRVACDETPRGEDIHAYLLGPAVLGRRDVVRAEAQAPNLGAGGGSAQWTVALALDRAGAARWHSFTNRHNTGGAGTSTSAVGCSPTGVRCADYVAFVVDGSVLAVPVTQAALGADTTISGDFTAAAARSLAARLR